MAFFSYFYFYKRFCVPFYIYVLFLSFLVKIAGTVQSSLFFAKVFLVFSCKLPKVTYSRNFLLTRIDFCGNLFQQFNITYLLRVPARLPKEPEQVFNFLSLHNEPEPRPSRKGWSGSGCCVAIFYCQIQHRTLKTA